MAELGMKRISKMTGECLPNVLMLGESAFRFRSPFFSYGRYNAVGMYVTL